MEEIQECEKQLLRAMIDGNVEKLDELIADNLVFSFFDKGITTKQDDLNAYKSKAQKIYELKQLEQKIQDFGNIAVVTANIFLKGEYLQEKFEGNFQYVRVWMNLNGRWQIVAGSVNNA